jgi:hypothetical protein
VPTSRSKVRMADVPCSTTGKRELPRSGGRRMTGRIGGRVHQDAAAGCTDEMVAVSRQNFADARLYSVCRDRVTALSPTVGIAWSRMYLFITCQFVILYDGPWLRPQVLMVTYL